MKKRAPPEELELESNKKSRTDNGKNFIQLLFGVVTEDEFFSTHWRKKCLLSTTKSVLKEYPINDLKEILSRVPNCHLITKEDVHFTKYNEETDDMEEFGYSGICDWGHIEQAQNDGFSVKLTKPYVYSQPIKDLYNSFDKFFEPINDIRLELTLAPPNCASFAPCCDRNDIFILQVLGSQTISIYNLPIPKSESDKTILTFSLEDLQPHLLQTITLEPGDCLYIPDNLVFFQKSLSRSLDLGVGIPPQPDWEDILELTLHTLKNKFQFRGDKPQEKGLELLQYSAKKTHSFLLEAVDHCEKVSNHIMLKRKWSKLDFEASQWVDKYDIVAELEKPENDGIIKISNFLPIEVADRIYSVIQEIREDQWLDTSAEQDYTNNNISHKFVSSKEFNHSETIFSLFRRLVPERELTISAARYGQGHFIAPHDDNAQKLIAGQVFWRKVALVYYLTPNWTAEDGGVYVDLQGKKNFVPEYNSLVAFVVPREHEVTVVKGNKPRYSIFGWVLEEDGESSEPEENEDNQDE